NSYSGSVTNGAGSTSLITIDADNTSYTFIGEGDNEWLNSTTQAALSGTVTSDDGTIASNIVIRYTAKSAAVNGIATIKWNVVEGAASYKIEMTDWSGKYGIETINVSADSLNVVDGVASLSVTGPDSDKWLNNPDNLRYRVTASFEGVNTAVLGLGIAISSEGREKAVAAMKRNNLLVQQDDSEDLEVSPEIPSINEWSGVSIQQFVEGLLSKIRLEASLDIFIARGNYNISELINNILEKLNVNIEGLDESGIVWSLTDDLRFNLELQLLFSLGESAEDTKLVLELSSSGLSFNDGEGGVLGVINPGVLLGLYYQNGKAFIDLSNVTLLGIQMPCYTFDIEVYTLIKDVIDSLFVDFDFGPIGSGLDVKTQSNSSGEVFAKWNAHSKAAEYKVEVFEPVYNEDNKEFAQWRSAGVKSVPAGVTMTDITALIGDNSYYKLDVTALDSDGNVIVTASVTIGDTQSGNTVALNGDTDGISMKNLLLLGISSERLHIQATTKAVASLLSTFLSGNATVSMISDLLGMFDIAISGEWKSKEALTLKLQGDLFQNNNYTPVKTVCGGVEYKVSDLGATFSWDEYGLASSYNLVIRDSLNRVVADVVSDTNSVFVPFDSNFTVATLAPNGGSWNAYAVMNTPLNIMAKLHTEKLLNTEDMDKVSADIDSALSRVDIDAAMEKYSSKLIAGLLDKVYNIALGVQLDFGSVDKFSLSEVLSIMVGDMLLGAAGLSVGE
ncbi:MAG: hypothetical protein K2I79_00710, partial [Clostridia bacterium]|nr:hypothetical protein [Clostridia bacterium]